MSETLLPLNAALDTSLPRGASGFGPPWKVPSQERDHSRETLSPVTDSNLNRSPSYLLSSQEAN